LIVVFRGITQALKWLILLEILSWGLAFLLDKGALNYLIIQSIFVPFVFLSLLFNSLVLFSLRMLFKMGLPPFHFWFFKVVKRLNSKTFLFFRTLHKVVPIIVLVLISSKIILKLRVILSFFRVFLLSTISNVKNILISSSFFHTGWIVIASTKRGVLVLSYWAIYRIVLAIVINSLMLKSLNLWNVSINEITLILLLILSGMPPLRLFWWKVRAVEIILRFSLYLRLLMLLFSVLAIWVYSRILFLSLNLPKIYRNISLYLIFLIFLGICY
jgi:NADH:ubiquinone oxidoreductase subunit 2 (subunit N)